MRPECDAPSILYCANNAERNTANEKGEKKGRKKPKVYCAHPRDDDNAMARETGRTFIS